MPGLKAIRVSNCRCCFQTLIQRKKPFLKQKFKKATLSSGLKGLSASIFVPVALLLPFIILVQEGVVENSRDCRLQQLVISMFAATTKCFFWILNIITSEKLEAYILNRFFCLVVAHRDAFHILYIKPLLELYLQPRR